MLKLTKTELAVMDHFHIVPNNFNGEGTLPSATEVGWWLADRKRAKDAELRPLREGKAILDSLRLKLWNRFESDSISIEDTATWVLSHYFTFEQLVAMKGEDAEKFLKDWKYFFGFRKCDGWGAIYISNAIDALVGKLVLDKKSKEYVYIKKIED